MFRQNDKVGSVVGMVVILLAVGAGVWGVVKLKSSNPDTATVTQSFSNLDAPTVPTSSNNSGTNQLKETKTDVGTFVQIPKGEFMMGSENDNEDQKPVHKVKISKGSEMGKYEVTQAQWEAVMGNNPSYFKGVNLPVEQVSWNDAQEFIKKLNARNDGYVYRLPTEAEWEYACRAGSTGDYAGNLNELASTAAGMYPVGQKRPNVWGLYDMHGKVWEWCNDWYDENYYKQSPSVDPSGPGTDRVLRGGSGYNPASNLRSATRHRHTSDSSDFTLGFRLVRMPR